MTRNRGLRRAWHHVRGSLQTGQRPPSKSVSTDDVQRGFPDWPAMIAGDWPAWQAAVAAARRGPLILIPTSLGGFITGTNVETLLAVALTLRGAQVHFLLCDGLLPACQQVIWHEVGPEQLVEDGPELQCRLCWPVGQRTMRSLELPLHTYSHHVTSRDRSSARQVAAAVPFEDIPRYRLDDLAVGEHAEAGALRYFARGTLDGEAQGEAVLRKFLQAALLTVAATRRVLRRWAFQTACFNHGIYVPQGLIAEVARQAGVKVVNWNAAYRKHCFIFSHHETYHHALMHEPTSNWENLRWTSSMDDEIMSYLDSRRFGTRDWIWFHELPEHDVGTLAAKLGLDLERPMVGLLSNVVWDAQLHYPANAFGSMLEWMQATVHYFAARPEVQLVIRIHPAEVRGTIPSRQRLEDEIRRAFPVLPGNVFVVPPDDPISTYALLERCCAALIYGTKMGVELASLGMPVIVAGEAWIRNKGVTHDAASVADYVRLLDRLPNLPALDEDTQRRARQYAYHFFMRRMIPLPMMVSTGVGSGIGAKLSGLDALRPGRTPGLDVICDGILHGREFIYPAEQLMPATSSEC